ncbi:helix-turn-helix transcriptional regulator [Bacillus sp. B15-48]|uniref:helix-turn-helix domain-containing protein n=1 Tax=Bacillus sp. B15-48 TaxID=1548601 RepID=UPI00193F96B2|nr:helix-turn-helix transcriptional regulator [Bacillus sp. B15-48]MBM4762684.1 XRE family transcriptional regulator [Bacillus sp. B15-48]
MNKEFIKFLRKSYNLNQRDFAKIVNCSFALIALVEVGKRRVTENLEEKIKDAFDLDENQIQSITAIIKNFGEGAPPFI